MNKLSVYLITILIFFFTGCSQKPQFAAADRQDLNKAWAYFLYAKADLQLSRMSRIKKINEAYYRDWIVSSLKQPSLKTVSRNNEFTLGFDLKPNFKLKLGSQMEINPDKKFSDILIEIFRETPAVWDKNEQLWRLPPDYLHAYNKVINDDRYKDILPLQFYQNPYPKIIDYNNS